MTIDCAEIERLRELCLPKYGLTPHQQQTRANLAYEALPELLDELERLRATVGRVRVLGSGPGFCMGDTTLIALGDVRAALKGPP